MWRSFFYAVGIGLFFLGGQALVTDHVVIPKNTRFQKLIRRVLSDGNSQANNANLEGSVLGTQASNIGPFQNQFPQGAQNQGGLQNGNFAYNSRSRFGPSRFSGPTYGDYGGGRVDPNRRDFTGQFVGSTATDPRTQGQLAGFRGIEPVAGAQSIVETQNFKIREWMPWSLLAAGAIIFLYTHSRRRRNSE